MIASEQSVEVAAPLEAVYDAWARFEDLPEFFEDVEEVRQLDDTHLRVRSAGQDFDTEIVEQRPCERITWQAVLGGQRGSARFERLGPRRTRLTLRLPSGCGGRVDLERFKATLERAEKV